MDAGNWATLIVAAISLISAIFSGRAAAGASKFSSKAQAETEAYNRARKMDVETIDRQDKEIKEIQAENAVMLQKMKELKIDNERLHEDNDRLRRRVTHLERLLGEPSSEQSTTNQ
jgi:predicted RNase H-like nuclease (RuvC/YqgF family)